MYDDPKSLIVLCVNNYKAITSEKTYSNEIHKVIKDTKQSSSLAPKNRNSVLRGAMYKCIIITNNKIQMN